MTEAPKQPHKHQFHISIDTSPPVRYCRCGAVFDSDSGRWVEAEKEEAWRCTAGS